MRKPTAKMFIDSEAFYDVLDLRSVGRGIADAKTKHQKQTKAFYKISFKRSIQENDHLVKEGIPFRGSVQLRSLFASY